MSLFWRPYLPVLIVLNSIYVLYPYICKEPMVLLTDFAAFHEGPSLSSHSETYDSKIKILYVSIIPLLYLPPNEPNILFQRPINELTINDCWLMAGSEGYIEMKLQKVVTNHLKPYYYIQKIWTNLNSNGTINVYSGVTEKPLAAFEANTANEWTDLFSEFYIIVIPPNTTIFIIQISDVYNAPTYKVLTHPYKSIGTWKYYGQNWKPEIAYDDLYFSIIIYKYDIKLTLLNMEVLESYQTYFYYNNTRFNVTSTFQPIILSDGDLLFYLLCNNSMQHCDVRMMIETIDTSDKYDTTTSN